MPKRTEYNVNGSAGAKVAINATIPCRFVHIFEIWDPSQVEGGAAFTPQGMQYWTNENGDNFQTQHIAQPGEDIKLGDEVAYQHGKGHIVGFPAQPRPGETIAATKLCDLLSYTATATRVMVVEYE